MQGSDAIDHEHLNSYFAPIQGFAHNFQRYSQFTHAFCRARERKNRRREKNTQISLMILLSQTKNFLSQSKEIFLKLISR